MLPNFIFNKGGQADEIFTWLYTFGQENNPVLKLYRASIFNKGSQTDEIFTRLYTLAEIITPFLNSTQLHI